MSDDVMTMSEQELRLEIARLKGAKWHEWDDGKGGKNKALRYDESFSYLAYEENGKVTLSLEMPDWDTEISEAWELVEEMPECRLIRVGKGTESEIWQCQSQSCGNWGDHTIESHHRDGTHYRCGCVIEKDCTAPLAICRAYVAWKRSQ